MQTQCCMAILGRCAEFRSSLMRSPSCPQPDTLRLRGSLWKFWQMPFLGQVAGKCPSLDRLLANALPWTVAVKCPSLDRSLPWTGCWQMPFPGQVAGKCPSLDRLLSNALPWTVAVKCPSLDRLMANALPWTGCCQKPFPGQVSGKCPSLDSNRREKCPQVNTLPNHAFDFSTRLDLRREFKNGPLILLVK